MKVLAKHFDYTERTTLNRMRKKLDARGAKLDAFKILISCLISLRVKDEVTERVSGKLFSVADTPEKIVAMSLRELEGILFSSGHYRKKAKVLKHVSRELINRFGGRVPDSREELLSIKGIGPKTANIVLSFAFDKLVIPVDVHCHRIPNRLGWVETKRAEDTEKALEIVLPKKYWREFNGIFVLFGKTICQPVSPKCSECPVNELCFRKGVGRSR